jgi:hypothetical protein
MTGLGRSHEAAPRSHRSANPQHTRILAQRPAASPIGAMAGRHPNAARPRHAQLHRKDKGILRLTVSSSFVMQTRPRDASSSPPPAGATTTGGTLWSGMIHVISNVMSDPVAAHTSCDRIFATKHTTLHQQNPKGVKRCQNQSACFLAAL